MARTALACAALLLLAPFAATAADGEVGFLGLIAPDLDADAVRAIEGRVEEALVRRATVTRREDVRAALLQDATTARALAAAREAAAAGDAAFGAFELDAARDALSRARDQYEAAAGEWTAPAEYLRVVEQRTRIHFALRRAGEMRAELARLVPLLSRAPFDVAQVPPDAQAVLREEIEAARAAPLAGPGPARVAELSRRGGQRWLLVGEARRRDGGAEMLLLLGSASGTLVSRTVRITPATPIGELERELGQLLELAGVASSARAERVLVSPPPRPAPTPAPRRSRTVWYVAGAIALGAIAAGAAVAASRDEPSRGGESEPDGISIVFEDP